MNTNSNAYTIIYSAILVVVVAAALAITAIVLKEPQNKNIETEKKQSILLSFGKGQVPENTDKNTFISQEYDKYVVDSYLVGVDGEKKQGEKNEQAFDIDMKVQLAAEPGQRLLPVFVSKDEAGKVTYVLPVRGAGLWGAIWGYFAISEDCNTVVGAVFDHAGETPGLGAEIATAPFSNQFIGKQIFEGEKLVSVAVVKPGSVALDAHSVDGISGGTITSTAVSDMLLNCLESYKAFLVKQKMQVTPEPTSDVEEAEGEDADSAAQTEVVD